MQENERKYKWYYSPKCTFKNEKKADREKTMVSVLTRAKKCAKISFVFEKDAGVAQSVEQLIRNQQVAGSSPASSSILKRAACQIRLAALFTGFRPKFHRRSGAAFSFLSFFFRAASPVTRLPCFAFLFLPRKTLFRRKRFPFLPYLSLLLLFAPYKSDR